MRNNKSSLSGLICCKISSPIVRSHVRSGHLSHPLVQQPRDGLLFQVKVLHGALFLVQFQVQDPMQMYHMPPGDSMVDQSKKMASNTGVQEK